MSATPATHRPWRYMLLAAMVAGIAGLFLPFVDVKGPITLGFTAFDLSFKMEKTHKLVDTKLPAIAKRRLQRVTGAQQDLQLVLQATRYAALAFVPAILLGVLGVIGLLRRRVGRVLGLFAVPLGLASIGTWIALKVGIKIALEEAELGGRVTVELAWGAHLLLAVGGLAVIAGIGALAAPDTKDEPVPAPVPVSPPRAA